MGNGEILDFSSIEHYFVHLSHYSENERYYECTFIVRSIISENISNLNSNDLTEIRV